MSSHEFARMLLAGPDVPILLPAGEEEEGATLDPVTSLVMAQHADTGEESKIILITPAWNP